MSTIPGLFNSSNAPQSLWYEDPCLFPKCLRKCLWGSSPVHYRTLSCYRESVSRSMASPILPAFFPRLFNCFSKMNSNHCICLKKYQCIVLSEHWIFLAQVWSLYCLRKRAEGIAQYTLRTPEFQFQKNFKKADLERKKQQFLLPWIFIVCTIRVWRLPQAFQGFSYAELDSA